MERKIYLTNTPLEKACELLWSVALRNEMSVEDVPTEKAAGRITATPHFARISSPHYHASAMDGVALKSRDTFGATTTSPRHLILGENVFYIDTGGVLPQGCDAVIMIEDIYFPKEDNPDLLEIREPATPWQHVRSIGEDIVASEMILPSFHYIRPFDVGALLNGGIFEASVLKKPVVALVPTGIELISPGTLPTAGEIIESNSYTFAAAVEDWGGLVVRYPVVKDDPKELEEAVKEAVSGSDLVLISAGSSAGRRDHTFAALNNLGQVLVHGVAIRPGKPVILGEINSTPVIGVPGYPVAAYMILELFVKPLLYRWQKQNPPEMEVIPARSSRLVLSSLKEREFLRLKVGKLEEEFVATPLPRGSGVSMSLVQADGITSIPQDKEGLEVGEEIEVELWRDRDKVENTIVCLGSHDLSLDILADHLRRRESGYALSSAHVGSMGGIMALKRGETHMVGVHLLDEESGTYNVPCLQRFLPELNLVLIHLALRDLGLMVPPGNPRGISGLKDLCGTGLVFINRQKGAGTRLFLDYKLKEQGLDAKDISGYEREEFNHLAVAAAVAAGSADAGLGIEAAARALGVDFIPLAQEFYELAMTASFYNSLRCQEMLEIIVSTSFREAVEKMGGYDLQKSGDIVWRSNDN